MTATQVQQADVQAPAHIGKYEVVRVIGHGATSTIYLCRDPFGDRDVAVKLLRAEVLADPRTGKLYRKQFMTEAALAGKLMHPHIAAIYDAAVEGELRYVVMEYVGGGTLDSYADPDHLLPIPMVLEISYKCCKALEFAQQQGIIHRDIKPANILLTETGDIKISDFGCALLERADSTQVAGVGSPMYMSPEQIEDRGVNHQSDIYSLGVVLYRLLAGRPPFVAGSAASMTYQIVNLAPPPLREFRRDVPETLEAIVMKAIAKSREERYATWDEFAHDLATVGHLAHAGPEIPESARFRTLKELAFFRDFGDVELWEVVRISQWTRHPQDEVLISEGAPGVGFFVLARGEVRVLKQGHLLTTLGPGDCFGEMAYIDRPQRLRTASVVAGSEVTAIRIDAAALDRASENCRLRFSHAFLRILVKRLSEASAQLSRLMI